MADFRKWLFAFAVVALLLGMGTSASAQGINNAAFACTANAGVPPIVRAEGITELVGDLILNCTGGTFTPAGQQYSPVQRSDLSEHERNQPNVRRRSFGSDADDRRAVSRAHDPGGPNPPTAGPATGSAYDSNRLPGR